MLSLPQSERQGEAGMKRANARSTQGATLGTLGAGPLRPRSPDKRLQRTVALAATCLLLLATAVQAAEPRDPATGPRLAAKLDAPLTASWLNVELRTLLERVAAERQLAVLIDRRIDPNRVCALEVRE